MTMAAPESYDNEEGSVDGQVSSRQTQFHLTLMANLICQDGLDVRAFARAHRAGAGGTPEGSCRYGRISPR